MFPMNWLRRLTRLFRRTPTGPQPLTPGHYQLEAYVKFTGGDWVRRSKSVEVTEPGVFASTLGSEFIAEIGTEHSPVWFDDVSVRVAPDVE